MDDLKAMVVENGADIGFAFDGDADRCLAVDENGELIDGDKILAICGLDMKQRGELAKDTIVGTVMSNLGLTMMGRENGIEILQTAVGDRYVLERMLADGYNIGGEQSGHVIFLDYNSTGDGVLTAIQLLSVLKRSGKKASELADVMQVLPQVLVNARVNNAKKNNYMDDEVVRKGIEELEQEFSQDGRVLIRTSGTEPLVRVMIEGKDIEKMDKAARKLASLIEERLK
jgi:phosphoglucosamine mutase